MRTESDNTDAGGALAETEWITFRASPIHGTGGFARREIPAGTRLLEYLGEKIDKAESLRRCVAAGEELTFNYGFDLVDYKDHPCQCGAANCVGFMVAEVFFDHVRQQRELADADSAAPPSGG